jgi:hypothetical protein
MSILIFLLVSLIFKVVEIYEYQSQTKQIEDLSSNTTVNIRIRKVYNTTHMSDVKGSRSENMQYYYMLQYRVFSFGKPGLPRTIQLQNLINTYMITGRNALSLHPKYIVCEL